MTEPQAVAGVAMMRAEVLYGLDAAEIDAIVQGAEKSAIEGSRHRYTYRGWTPPTYLEGAKTLHCKATLVVASGEPEADPDRSADTPPKTEA